MLPTFAMAFEAAWRESSICKAVRKWEKIAHQTRHIVV